MSLTEPPLVLLVEDNEDHAELVIRSLDEQFVPHRLLHLNDGQKALDYLSRQGVYSELTSNLRPRVVLLDLRLPKVDGLEVLHRLKQSPELQTIPVVILTSSGNEQDVARAYANHANSYLVKPVGFDDFDKMMQNMSFYWLNWNVEPNL